MIDIVKSEKAFKEYLENYDMNDDKVKLKEVHTYGVLKASDYLASNLGLDEENISLAKLIALLHDIGRFEQTKICKDVYDIADKMFFDHAEYGIKILFEDNMIRKFIDDPKYDDIIYKSIKNHNRLSIEDGLNEQELLHARIIRDADKIDNFRVKLTEKFKVLLGTDNEDAIFNDKISDVVYKQFMSKNLVNIHDQKTYLDRWSTYVAFIFDMNFEESFKYLKENDLINKIFDRLKYYDPETKERINSMRKLSIEFIDEKCN